ncbi:LytTR family DNA-binding domain-containing protein [Longimicrobium sp.]|uniref:LytTR family DNA-binding domain-containing protein n=1 Tax=Longimicrobium sp. TaxID=2029185 RepID=UPI002E31E6CE|nr:LytTR family DNA-binding domain-containing protein [Longimicrobium sp.]HEX6037680.1 LytTR family DNA-binding domain-containing protein [Longimicrobium sp.]
MQQETAGQISLNELERRLDPACFRRVHRAHIVNLDHVSSIRPYDERRLSVRFADGSEVVASRAGSQLLREMVLTVPMLRPEPSGLRSADGTRRSSSVNTSPPRQIHSDVEPAPHR